MKYSIKRVKRQDWEKIFTKHVSIKGLVSRAYKELPKLDIKSKLIFFQLENSQKA